MVRMTNLLTAGLMFLLAASAPNLAVAGHRFGGNSGGGSSGFKSSQVSGRAPMQVRPNYSVQPSITRHVGSSVGNPMKVQQFHNNLSGKFNKVPTQPTLKLPNHSNLGSRIGQGPNLGIKNSPLKSLPINKSSNSVLNGKFSGLSSAAKVNSLFTSQKLTQPHHFHSFSKSSGFWSGGSGCGWGHGHCGWGHGGCGWGHGGCHYTGCGYWPGYFDTCCTYPCYTYPTCYYTPTYFTAAPIVQVAPVVQAAPEVQVASAEAAPVLSEVPVPPAPTTSLREIDLGVKDVRLVEAAAADRGALYRVTIINQGPSNTDVPTRVAVLGMKDSQPGEGSPRVIETIKSLNAGESASVDVRMPVTANALPNMLVAVEIPEAFKDTDDKNNVAAGETSKVPQLAAAIQ